MLASPTLAAELDQQTPELSFAQKIVRRAFSSRDVFER